MNAKNNQLGKASKTIYNYSPDDLILYGVIAIRCIMILALGYLIRRLWEKYTLPR